MFNVDNLVRPNIKALTPYTSARDEFSGEGLVMLDANENPYGTLNRYPDPYQCKLKQKIAAIKAVPAQQIFIGNGSDQVIDLLFRIFCRPGIDRVAAFTPTYGMYQVSAAINDTTVLNIPLGDDFTINQTITRRFLDANNLKMIFVCNPNNPTGNSLPSAQIKWLLDSFNGIVIVDEAYIDFCPKMSSLGLLDRYPNLVVMQTLSKAFGLAGLRIGMAYASSQIIAYLNKVKPPYNISTVNQNEALKSLESPTELSKTVAILSSEKKRLIQALSEISLIEQIFPSDSNFLLVKVKNALALYDALRTQGLIVRNRDSAVANCLRITVGTPSQNNQLIDTLNKLA